MELTSTRVLRHYVKALVYGNAGVGKTTLCKTAPNPIIISAESGLLSLADVDLPVLVVSTLSDLHKAYKYVKQRPDEWDTLCVDSHSEIAEQILAERKPQHKDPRKAYGEMADEMMELTKALRGLPMHVVVTAKQDALYDEFTKSTEYRPYMPGKAFTLQVPYYFDLVMPLRVDLTSRRFLQTQPTPVYTAKVRDPFGLLDKEEKPDLNSIFQKLMKGNDNVTTAC